MEIVNADDLITRMSFREIIDLLVVEALEKGKQVADNGFSAQEAAKIAKAIGLDFSKESFTFEEFLTGVNVELEHSGVTHKSPTMTGKIALDHLREDPKYYEKLAKIEESYLSERTLYHGTIVDHEKSILKYGLIPGVGQFTRDMYGAEEDDDDNAMVYAADKSSLHKAANAIEHNVANKLGKDRFDLDEIDIRNHGLLLVIQDGDGSMSQASGSDRYGYEEPAGRYVEPNDWYSSNVVGVDYALKGPKLIAFFKRHGITFGPKNIGAQQKKLLALVQKVHPDKPQDVIWRKIATVKPHEISQYMSYYEDQVRRIK